ncbi:MAG: PEGA domain-containing protein [Candidatus Cloacimonetes bacterium]|nr:PEGA domain-containing protein [Candidatus Cloacimonadota bacterium]
MKRMILILLMAFSLYGLFANDMIITSDFTEDMMDLTNQKEPRRNINDELCALIKISTALTNLNFPDRDITDVVQKEGEVWLYVTAGKKYLSITKSGFAKFEYSIPIRMESGRVYKIKLEQKAKGFDNLLKDTYNLSFSFNENDVFIIQNNDTQIKAMGNSARFKLAKGKYTFKFAKKGFKDITKEINLTKDHYEEISMEAGNSNTRFKLPALVIINAQPAQADIYIDNQRIGLTPFQGEILAGDHQLMIQHPLYETYAANFKVEEGQSLTLPEIKLISKFAFLTLTSNPSQADVFVDDKLLGKTPLTDKEIPSDSKQLKLVYPLYKDYLETLTLKDQDKKSINAMMEQNYGEISISSKPEEGAAVYLNNEKIGETPISKLKLIPGIYSFRIQKNMWMDDEFMAQVENRKHSEKTIVLNKNYSVLDILAENSDIYIDNVMKGKNHAQAQLVPGTYQIRAKRDRFYDDTREYKAFIGKDEQIELQPQPIMGSVSVMTDPKETQGASVFINNIKQDKTSPAVIPLQIGEYDVRVSFPGYVDKSEKVLVTEAESKPVNFSLQIKNVKYLNRASAWKTQQKAGLISALACVLASGYFAYAGYSDYDAYQSASTSAKADSFYESSLKNDKNRNICLSLSAVSLVYYGFARYRENANMKYYHEK